MKKLRYLVPRPLRYWLNRRRTRLARAYLVVDRVTDWSVLRRVRPYRPRLGERRGECIDRYYIEKFIAGHGDAIRGRIAEFLNDDYTTRFAAGPVERLDIIDIDSANPYCTLNLDLTRTEDAPKNLLDCIVCTQTLFLIYDFEAAIRTLHQMLKPGGVLLVTVPGICQRLPQDLVGDTGEWWRFLGCTMERAFKKVFRADGVQVQTFGNVVSTIALLHGLVQAELTQEELDYHDPDYEVVIGVRATK